MPKDLVINNGKLDTTKLVGAPNVRQINYILNADAEVDTSGWTTYADAAQATPVDGTGGTPQASLWIRSTTTPIRGAGSFRLDKTGSATRQGQGTSYNFTIDKADQAKVLTVSFDYEVVSGTYATGDLTVYIYDVTNAQVIQPAGYQVEALGSGVQNKLIATFQTASNSTSYRLILHVASASTQNYTLAFDNVTVGPQTVQYGAPITDWQDYTPTFTALGTPTSVAFRSRRVGSDLEIQGAFTTGTGIASQARISLGYGGQNSNVTIDTSKISTNAVVGNVGFASNSTGYAGTYVLATGANNYLNISAQSDTGHNLTASNGNAYASGLRFQLYAKVPIAGWGSSVVMSDSTDTRVVSCLVQKTGDEAVTGGVTNIQFTSVAKDTHGSWNGTTTYTVRVPGDYIVSAGGAGSGNGEMFAFVNGVRSRSITGFNTVYYMTGSCLIPNLKAGDLLTVRSSATTTILAAATDSTWLSISRVSGPSAIAATETVALSYYSTATTAFGNGPTTVAYATKNYDSHNAWNGTVFTAPIAGKYRFTAAIYLNGVVASGQNIWLRLRNITSTAEQYIDAGNHLGTVNTENRVLSGSATIELLAGQTADIRLSTNTAANQTQTAGSATSQFNFLMVERVGN